MINKIKFKTKENNAKLFIYESGIPTNTFVGIFIIKFISKYFYHQNFPHVSSRFFYSKSKSHEKIIFIDTEKTEFQKKPHFSKKLRENNNKFNRTVTSQKCFL